MKLVNLLTQADAAKLIVSIGERATVLQEDIHQAGCSTLDHARAHGDWTGITRLCDALPKGQRVKALAAWYRHFSNGRVSLSIDPETKLWKVNKEKFAERKDEDFQIEKAMEVTFADLTEEKDPVTLTLAAWLKGVKRTATNAANFDGTDIPKVSPALRAVASEVAKLVETKIAELEAAKLTPVTAAAA